MKKDLNVGLVGCGFIGTALARDLIQRSDVQLVGIMDSVSSQAEKLQKTLAQESKTTPPMLTIPAMVEQSDLLIEAAHPKIVPELLERCIHERTHLMVMSVGGLLDQKERLAKAKQLKLRICYPTGAIAGLDGIRAASLCGIRRIQLITTKTPKSLGLHSGEKQVVFEGSVADAIARFPQNVNIAATLALTSGNSSLVSVRIVCDPSVQTNTHDILVESGAGIMHVRLENTPSSNPKTSMLAVLSARVLLSELISSLTL